MQLVDYVVAHELVHALQPDHTAEFWARVGRATPDYERRDRLQGGGREYER
jgi:predicted metal-dependent hydrolase